MRPQRGAVDNRQHHASGDLIGTCLCCRREFLYGIDFQMLGRAPLYCRHCREHHQQLALVPKTRKPRTRKIKAS